MNSNELTQMLLDAGFPYTMDTLHNMDKFQKLLEIEREQCAKLCGELASNAAKDQDFHALSALEDAEQIIRDRGNNG